MNSMAKSDLRVVLGFLLLPAQAQAAEKKSIMMLDEKFCESYPKEIADGLMGVKGVAGVDLKSMKGHAVVTHDETVNPAALVTAMKGVKGTTIEMEWYCSAEAVK